MVQLLWPCSFQFDYKGSCSSSLCTTTNKRAIMGYIRPLKKEHTTSQFFPAKKNYNKRRKHTIHIMIWLNSILSKHIHIFTVNKQICGTLTATIFLILWWPLSGSPSLSFWNCSVIFHVFWRRATLYIHDSHLWDYYSRNQYKMVGLWVRLEIVLDFDGLIRLLGFMQVSWYWWYEEVNGISH